MPVITRHRQPYRQDQQFSRPFKKGKGPQADGLVGWWPPIGSIGENIIRDYGPNKLDAALAGTVAWQSVQGHGASWVADGTGNEYASVPHNALLEPATVTFGGWVYIRSTLSDQYAHVIGKDHSASSSPYYNYHIDYDQNGDGYWRFICVVGEWADTNMILISMPPADVFDRWYHVMGTFDGNDMRAYIDGFERGSKSNPGSINYSGQPLAFGTYLPSALMDHDGFVGDMRVYNRAKNASEVYQLYAPQTRFELYAPIPRFFPVGVAVAPSVEPIDVFQVIVNQAINRAAVI